jgi:murein DD-endopeptidase MepM/ murein hydrolase activator NlpD
MSGGKYLSLLIVPDEGGKTLNFRIHRNLMRFFLTVILLVILAILAGGVYYGKLLRDSAEAVRLRAENKILLSQQSEITRLKRELERNRQFVKRFAALAGIEDFTMAADDTSVSPMQDSLIAEDTLLQEEGSFMPSGYPIRGFISKRFSESGLFGEKHLGLDITCPEGSMIRVTADGTVDFAGWDNYFGYIVKIKHEHGYMTVYAHNQELRVKEGDKVKKGQIIALSGNSGQSTGPHLHYEVLKDGKPMDPEDYL